VLLGLTHMSFLNAQVRCDSHSSHNARPFHPHLLSSSRELIQIPVVFHNVWRTERHLIDDDQILTQLDIINADYNGRNADRSNVPDQFRNVIGSANIEFCLATVDADGNSSTGIVRQQTTVRNIGSELSVGTGFRAVKQRSSGGSDPWDINRYLNIWIAERGDGNSGDSTFPNEESLGDDIDGIVIAPNAFGINEDEPRFGLGRTLTHEIGHYLDLFHLFGSETGCFSDDDLVEDTPTQAVAYFGPCVEPVFSCDSRDMDMNFMALRDDECLIFFTRGQVQRMRETLFTKRFSLISNNICGGLTPIPDDPLEVAQIFTRPDAVEVVLAQMGNRKYEIDLFDITGRRLQSRQSTASNSYSFSSSMYPRGIYILRLRTNDNSWSRKVLLGN
ncbi:MAG: zinc-dependent metalloprotease, partial [Bacteroidota bacterium]